MGLDFAGAIRSVCKESGRIFVDLRNKAGGDRPKAVENFSPWIPEFENQFLDADKERSGVLASGQQDDVDTKETKDQGRVIHAHRPRRRPRAFPTSQTKGGRTRIRCRR